MWKTWRGSILAVLALVGAAAVAILLSRDQQARAQSGPAANVTPQYSVIETQAHNLIVTDNRSNILYFYTIDKDKDVGTELRLRGTIDLREVGKPVIKPVTTNAEK